MAVRTRPSTFRSRRTRALLELVFALAVSAEPALQAASPFYLRLTRTADGFSIALLNRSKKVQPYLYDAFRQPFEPILVDAQGTKCKPLDLRSIASGDGHVWRKFYRRLEPEVETVLATATVSGSPVDRFTLRAPPFECAYLAPGRYRLSFVWRSATRACDDCNAREKAELARVWLGVIRSNEIEVLLE